MSEDIIDLKDVLERVQDDKELLLELLDIYQEDFIEKRKALHEAVNGANVTAIKEVAHSMKGSSGNISAKPMHALCLKIEQLAKESKVEEIKPLLSDVDRYFEQIKVNTDKLKREFSA